jgi:hypothetical protein
MSHSLLFSPRKLKFKDSTWLLTCRFLWKTRHTNQIESSRVEQRVANVPRRQVNLSCIEFLNSFQNRECWTICSSGERKKQEEKKNPSGVICLSEGSCSFVQVAGRLNCSLLLFQTASANLLKLNVNTKKTQAWETNSDTDWGYYWRKGTLRFWANLVLLIDVWYGQSSVVK